MYLFERQGQGIRGKGVKPEANAVRYKQINSILQPRLCAGIRRRDYLPFSICLLERFVEAVASLLLRRLVRSNWPALREFG